MSDSPAPLTPDERAKRALADALRRPGTRGQSRSAIDAGLGCLGFFVMGGHLLPVIASEHRLIVHCAMHRGSLVAPPPLARPDLLQASVGLRGGPILRPVVVLVSVAVGALLFLVGTSIIQSRGGGVFGEPGDWVSNTSAGVQIVTMVQLIYTLPYVAYVHLVRAGVRTHERLWLQTIRPDAELVLAGLEEDWNARYVRDVVLSLAAFVPVLGIVAALALAGRFSGALELHEQHEAQLTPPPELAARLLAPPRLAPPTEAPRA